MDFELADIIYVFSSPNEMGIKFYDRSPSGAIADLTGSVGSGKFITDIHSIQQASWDKNLNMPNSTQRCKTRRGSVVIKTYMVSDERMLKILDSIIKAKDPERIVIDVGNTFHKSKKEIYEELLSNINTFDNNSSRRSRH